MHDALADHVSEARLVALIDALADLSPFGKRLLLHACGAAAANDEVLAPAEMELLRALAESWDCPIPPALPAALRTT